MISTTFPKTLLIVLATVLGDGGPEKPQSSKAGAAAESPPAAPTQADKEKAAPPAEETTVPFDNAEKGALQVKGDTGDWFSVWQGDKRASPGVPPRLGGTIELAAGDYEVYVNKTKRKVTITAGKKTVLLTGTLVVEGKGDWYTPYQGDEAKLVGVQPRINSPVALFAGTYSVYVYAGTKNDKLTDDAKVTAGKKTVVTSK